MYGPLATESSSKFISLLNVCNNIKLKMCNFVTKKNKWIALLLVNTVEFKLIIKIIQNELVFKIYYHNFINSSVL